MNNWPIQSLGKGINLVRGVSYKKKHKVESCFNKVKTSKRYSQKELLSEGKVPVLDQTKASIIGYHNNDPDVLADEENPVITFANHTTNVRFITFNFSVIQNVFPLRPADGVDAKYFYYAISGAVPQDGYKGHWPRLQEQEIPLPPLSEQKRIAAKLDTVFSHIKQAKTLRQESQDLADDLLSSALHQVFSQAEENGWEEKTVEEITRTTQYGYTSSAQEEGNAKFLRITDIQHRQVQWSQVPYCDCDNIEKYRLFKGDIVFARTGATVGKSFFIENPPQDTVFASYLIRVIAQKEQCLPKFLFYFFQSPQYWKQITEYKSGGAQPSVNGKKLKSLRLPLPPLEEQHRLVRYLDTLAERATVIQTAQGQIADDLTHLEQSLLHKAFEGEL